MPVEVYEDVRDLLVPSVEAVPPDPRRLSAAYPLPDLRDLARPSLRTFSVVVIQNDWLRAAICPDLGGRIVELRNLKTGMDSIAPPGGAASGGVRGVWLPYGVEIAAGHAPRANSMGPVDFIVREATDERSVASVTLHEIVPGLGLSWHATIQLAPEAMAVEVRFRMVNRGFAPSSGLSGVVVGRAGTASADGGASVVGLAIEGGSEAVVDLGGGTARLGVSDRKVGPRDTVSWTAHVMPLPGSQAPSAVGAGGAVWVESENLRLMTAMPAAGKLLLLTEDGRDMEAPVSAEPGEVVEFPIAELGRPEAVALRVDGRDLLRWDSRPNRTGPVRTLWDFPIPSDSLEQRFLSGGEPEPTALSTLVRGAALCKSAHPLLENGRYAEAAERLEEALLYNAGDHLAWWLKALAHQLAGEEGESVDLMNAHYLAPLEPALRAASLFAQGPVEGQGPNPMLAPLAGNPEALVEVACLLLDAGLTQQAGRWLDEAIRHADLPILRYLLGWCYLRKSRMDAEAAEQVRRATGDSVGPPYPWRPVEARAIRELSDRFPSEARLQGYRRLVDAAGL